MSSTSDRQQPVVLFDGPCNLCNAAVRWVIQRDHKGLFLFASLQSDAARAVLANANVTPESLPDSIVFVDRGQVLTRSDAALRIARRMGFPWALWSAAVVVPRFLRNAIYSWVARNRYGWFGRQNACMVPSPTLRARFLDADEPVRPVQPNPAAEARSGRRSPAGLPGTLLHRFVLLYLLIYVFPFPFSALLGMGYDALSLFAEGPASVGVPAANAVPQNPVVSAFSTALQSLGGALESYEQGKRWIVDQVALKLGTEIKVYPAGSGDTTYNYFELLVYAGAALLGASLWTLLSWGRAVGLRTIDAMNVLVRYNLAAAMLGYGWHKVWPVQMPPPGPDRLIGTIGDMSPMGLIWTMMGSSPSYQIFGGLGEVLGGVLLLFRRTTLLGALVTAGVMTNVVALNFCFDIPVKLYSSHLLFQALFLVIPHAARLTALLLVNLPAQPLALRPFALRSGWMWAGAQMFKLALLAAIAIKPALGNYEYLKQSREQKPWEGVYRVESFMRNGKADREVKDSDRWVRVGIAGYGVGAIQRADGTSMRYGMRFDENRRLITISSRSQPQPAMLRYEMLEPGVMDVTGSMQGAFIFARLRRDDEYKPLLTTRGFHWINEYPLNR